MTKPTDRQIVEVLATKGMGWERHVAFISTFQEATRTYWVSPDGREERLAREWNPLTDLNAIHEVEERIKSMPSRFGDSMLLYRRYVSVLARLCRVCWQADPYTECAWAIRHASARTCAEALYQVLEDSSEKRVPA